MRISILMLVMLQGLQILHLSRVVKKHGHVIAVQYEIVDEQLKLLKEMRNGDLLDWDGDIGYDEVIELRKNKGDKR